jgi:phosphate transport system permease protein
MNPRRVILDRIRIALAFTAVAIAVVPLLGIIFDVAYKAIPSINVDFFTMLPPLACPPHSICTPGGLGDAIQGTLILVALSSAIGIPIGIISGIYISEYGNRNRYGSAVRFLGDVLAGIPSIVTGVLVYILVVVPLRGFSVTAGSIALGSIMIPIVSNTSAEALKAVPNSIREASLALGVRKWRTSLLAAANAKRSIATASLLAIARVTGETAPLLLCVGTSQIWFVGFGRPVASLTWYIYYYATSPYSNWKTLAWEAAFVLIVIVMSINVGVRVLTRNKGRT